MGWATREHDATARGTRPAPGPQIALEQDADARLGGQLAQLVREVLGECVRLPSPADAGAPFVVHTGSYVVDPPFFGNGDIGRIAVCGTVNALLAAAARPRWLTLAITVEAGLPVELLVRLARSAGEAADEAGVAIASVDVRVVRAGDVDQVFVSSTGLGVADTSAPKPVAPRPGDRLVVTGPLGSHAVHLLSTRAALGYEGLVPSDCAPLGALLDAVPRAAVRAVGLIGSAGLAEALRGMATDHRIALEVTESDLPIRYEAWTAFDLLGLDPWHAACAGCCCLLVAPEETAGVLAGLRSHPYGRHAAVVGEVTTGAPGSVRLLAPDGRTLAPPPRDPAAPGPARLR